LAQGFGAALRLLQTGRVQVYAAGMVLGTAAVGWFLFAPHANAKVDNSGLANGKLILSAAPGHGYKYRWHLDGQKAPEGFDGPTRYVVNLTPCETRVVHLGVQNVFGRIDEREFTQCRETTPGCCRAPTGESGGTTAAIPTGRLPAEQHKKLVGPNRKGRKAGAAPSPSARRPAVPRPSALRPSALRPSAPRPSAPRPSAPRPSTPKAVTK
jgi:hypothetical protein